MINFIKFRLPLLCSAYAAALFVMFAFFYTPKLDYFVLINLLLFAFWSSYAWLIIWSQDNLILEMMKTMEQVRNSINEVIKKSEEAEED
jgi:hypothetical protein